MTRRDQFWLVLREPGRSPEQKGPWPRTSLRGILREFMAARPRAYILVLTIGRDGSPAAMDGPEWLAIADRRSLSTARAHHRQTLAAHSAPGPGPVGAVDP